MRVDCRTLVWRQRMHENATSIRPRVPRRDAGLNSSLIRFSSSVDVNSTPSAYRALATTGRGPRSSSNMAGPCAHITPNGGVRASGLCGEGHVAVTGQHGSSRPPSSAVANVPFRSAFLVNVVTEGAAKLSSILFSRIDTALMIGGDVGGTSCALPSSYSSPGPAGRCLPPRGQSSDKPFRVCAAGVFPSPPCPYFLSRRACSISIRTLCPCCSSRYTRFGPSIKVNGLSCANALASLP